MDPYQRSGRQSGSDFGAQLANLATGFLGYLKSRQPEHWLFFAIGIIVGMLIG